MSNKGDAANILTISPFAEVRPERVTADADSVMYGIANWSPDGREVVFVSDRAGTRDLWVISADGSARQVTSGPAQDWDPSFSPDGKQISYNSAETGHGGDTNLWTVNVSGEDARPLTTESLGDYGPRWSPDGRWIAFGSLRTGTWAIWVVPSTGGTPVQVPMRGYRAFMPCWSPDSKRIAFQAGSTTGNLLTIPATGGEPTVVAEGVYARYGTRASWSPDGSEIAFTQLGRSEKDLWKASIATGKKTQITNDGTVRGTWRLGVSWSPEGSSILFNSVAGGVSSLWTAPAGGGAAERVTALTDHNITWPEWSPGGDRVIFSSPIGDRLGIWSVTVEEEEPELVVDWSEGAWAPAWSPDGSAIAFSSKRSSEEESTDDNIWTMQVDETGDATWITSGSQADWSPDGTQICFIRDDDIWVIPSVGGRGTCILRSLELEREAWPQWSPGGTQILYSEAPGDYDIWVADVGELLESGN